ncbi:MAG: hypothetical protein E7663_04895 [Ruminococcaceae bacterium]|nr:hypothetical protein [Oscillospiraceae bacterium]
MFLADPYQYEPAGLFTLSHALLLTFTVLLIAVGLYASRHMTERGVRRTVRAVTASLWLLEIVKILFVLFKTKSQNPNDFIPLYYCSLILYAGLLSSVGRGVLQRMGDCFVATGSLVGGIVFLIMPTTSLPRYPALHLISLHSFVLHGLMVYLALLLLLRRVYRPVLRDIWYCVILVSVTCALALVFNTVYDRVSGTAVANLMFISKDFPGTPITLLYHVLGVFFSPFMWIVQAFGPFLLVWGTMRLVICPKKEHHA